MLVIPEIVDSSVGLQMLGTNFSRENLMGRFTNSILSYKGGNTTFEFGRSPIRWGQSTQYSIIQAGISPPYDFIRYKLKFGNIEGESFAGQLGSDTVDSNRIRRFISGHRLVGIFFNDKLKIEIGEQIIYTGKNRGIEFFYLNPVVPYIFAAYEDDDLDAEGTNNDNTIMFLSGRYSSKESLSTFFEFIIDDYQIYDDPVQNMLGWKVGAFGLFPLSKYILNWESDYTEIDSWTYIHKGQFTNWQNRGHAIGYPYGGDLRSFRFHINSWLKKDTFWLNLQYTWLKKGSNNIQTKSANLGTLSDPFPYPPIKVFHLFESSVTYHTKYVSLQTGYTNIPFPYEIANGLIDELRGGLYFNLQLKLRFEIDMEQDQAE